MTKEELQKLAQHLKNPQGKHGISIANNMHASNTQMIQKSIDLLDVKPHQHILEIGHGSGLHVPRYFEKAKNITFYGLEISDTMQQEAKKNNKKLNAYFKLYDGVILPFDEHTLDRIISVNTLYFWSKPARMLQEIEQTLKPKGMAVITFMDKIFMENLPFVGNEFTLYHIQNFTDLVEATALDIIDVKEEVEHVKSKIGEKVERKYYMVKMQKK